MVDFTLQWQSYILLKDTIRPTKPKTFTLWPFREKVCEFHGLDYDQLLEMIVSFGKECMFSF